VILATDLAHPAAIFFAAACFAGLAWPAVRQFFAARTARRKFMDSYATELFIYRRKNGLDR
jgi:hypothetical protein